MKIKFTLLLVLSIFFFSTFPTVFATNTSQRVFDYADLFSESEINLLEEEIQSFQKDFHADFVVLTINDAQGKSAQEYADDFYDENNFGIGSEKDGILFLIDMDHRVPHISTCGNMIDYLTDQRCEMLLDSIHSSLVDGDYITSVTSLLSGIEQYDKEEISAVTSSSPSTSGFHVPSTPAILIAVFLLIASGGIFCFVIYSKYKMLFSSYDYPYHDKSSLNLTDSKEHLLHKTVTKRKIERPNSSSGGRSHGGATGKRF